MVGDGIAALLDRMRRVQQRYRRPGEFIMLPPTPNLMERRLRMGDGRRILEDCDTAVRLAVAAQRSSGSTTGHVDTVLSVRVAPDEIEVTFVGGNPSAGRETEELSDRMRVERGRLREARTSALSADELDVPPPAPLLVTAGRSDGHHWFVNLEALGSLGVDGDAAHAEDFVRALALEVVTSYWSGAFRTTLVGIGRELLRFDRVAYLDDADGLVESLERRARRSRHGTGIGTSPGEGRRGTSGELPDPLVVICGPGVPADARSRIAEIAAQPGSGIVSVVVGPSPRARHSIWIQPDRGGPETQLLGSLLVPQTIDRSEVRDVLVLLDYASEVRSVAVTDPPYDELTVLADEGTASEAEVADQDDADAPLGGEPMAQPTRHGHSRRGTEAVEVEVCVLGPVEVRGASRPFTRAWAQELVVYLSLHPKGAANDVWAAALWPDRLMAPSSLHSTASVARRALGKSRDGLDHLPRSHGRLRLAPTVGSDWDRFRILSESGTPAGWRAALELVRGRPFTGLRASDWPVLEGIAPAIESTIVDVSGRLAGACLQRGDPTGAEWAARQGLLVSPYDERLYRMLFRAADAAGNPAGIESAMEELIRIVADEIEPLDSVHPSTLELYRTLTRRRTAVHAPVRPVRAARARLAPEARIQLDRQRRSVGDRTQPGSHRGSE